MPTFIMLTRLSQHRSVAWERFVELVRYLPPAVPS